MNFKDQTTLGFIGGLGFLIQLISHAMSSANSANLQLAGSIVWLIGAILVIVACTLLASAKGYSRWFGLLGLLNLLGLIIIAMLSNKNAAAKNA